MTTTQHEINEFVRRLIRRLNERKINDLSVNDLVIDLEHALADYHMVHEQVTGVPAISPELHAALDVNDKLRETNRYLDNELNTMRCERDALRKRILAIRTAMDSKY